MKRTFWTRNVWIGVLMAVVLALGVQGSADALTFGTTRTNDLQTIVRGNSFSVGFAVDLVDTSDIKSAYTGYIVDPNDPNRYFLDSTSGANDNDQYDSGESTVSTAQAFHYNNEAVRISVSGAGARITSIGANTITPATSITLKEGGSDAEELVASITVNCSTSSYGEVTITASDVTPSEDYPSGVRKAPNFVLTTYVVRFNQNVGTTRTIRLVGVTNGVAIGYDNQRDQPIYNGDGSHYPVTYSIVGSGTLYIKEGERGAIDLANRFGNASTPLVTSTAAQVLLNMTGTNTVTATLGGSFEESQGIYIFGNPQLNITAGNNQSGAPNAVLTTALQVALTDSAGTPAGVAGVPIKFDVTDKSPSGGVLNQADETEGTTIVDASNEVISSPLPGSTLYVRTEGTNGVANIDFQLGTISGKQTVTASALGIARLTKTFTVTATPEAGTRQLFAEEIDRQGSTNIYTLVARVENGGQPDPGEIVTFTTTKGLLTGKSLNTDGTLGATSTARIVYESTNAAGKARIIYNIGDASGNAEVIASISVIEGTRITQLQEVTFNVRGSGTRQPDTAPPSTTPTNRIGITLSSTTGAPGDEITLTVQSDPSVRFVQLGSVSIPAANFSPTAGITPFTSTVLLPDEERTHSISATGTGLTPGSATITVAGTTSLGEITISSLGAPSNGTQLFTITVRDTDDDRISSALTVRVSGSGFTATDVRTQNGIGDVRLTLPTRAALYTLTASAEGYESGETSVRITATDTGTDTGTGTGTGSTPPPTVEDTPSDPASVSIAGPSQRSGTANAELDAPLLVRVLDADGDAVEDARVIFRVRKGQGRLSQRGNGRAIAVQTDEDGYGRADYTPMSASSTVEAEVRGVSRTVTFTITASGGSAPPTTRDTGTSETPSATTAISPEVLLGAGQRPPIAWVDGGAIYTLVGASPQRFAPSVENALNIAIAGTKVYWTEQTGESSGTINSANVDGTGVKELKSIQAVPMGIAVDTANSLLYWTNSRGRIQRLNTDGSGRVENVLQNLERPMDLALAGGNAYWTQATGSVRFVNLRGQKQIRNISTGTDAAISLAISGGKVYWTEKTGESAGTINSANLNGNGATQLASIRAVPMGIGVDGSRSKLYWTNSRGRIQSSDLNGKKIQNVVDGLGMPGDMVLSNSIKAPAAEATTPTTRTTASTSKYDVNGDGSVDSKDVTALIDAISLGVTANKYDVNGDGKVDILDARAVNANLDAGAAAAPMLVGMKLSAVQIERLQEQIDLLIATGDRSPAAMRTLIYLQQLIVMARPEKTQLLANYPNPFNPETWMPYELATDTDVRLTIYNAQGVVIRVLHLGQQSAGYYTDRERAAYWDGRNALGERVASGIYFYQLETDDMSSLRKMVILK